MLTWELHGLAVVCLFHADCGACHGRMTQLVRSPVHQRASVSSMLDRGAQLRVPAFDRRVVHGLAITAYLVGTVADGLDQVLDGRQRCLRLAGGFGTMVAAAGTAASPLCGFWIAILHPIGRGDFFMQVTYLRRLAGIELSRPQAVAEKLCAVLMVRSRPPRKEGM